VVIGGGPPGGAVNGETRLRTAARREDPRTAIVAIEGILDSETSDRLEAALAEQLADGVSRFVLDLSSLEFCDSSGLSVLIVAHRRAVSGGGWIRLTGSEGQVRRVLEITNLGHVLGQYPDARAAIAGTDKSEG
jgi:anti-sigma B factor antagonist